uniref:G-protein coupled receptors family 2 profile 1 domain-containing protein n=1 Tax=Varanus komodoensis TaxID=61221 RepID=A0A8D2LM34_VARKO
IRDIPHSWNCFVHAPFCSALVDLIGTCWPYSAAGQLVARPCPEYFFGVRYNTTNNVYRECFANGSWATRVNYSQCQEILNEEVWGAIHFRQRGLGFLATACLSDQTEYMERSL